MLPLRGVEVVALLASITLGAVRSVPAATPVRFAPLAPVPDDTAPEPVGIERLGDLLGLMFSVDWSELTATVVDPSSLPIARRLQREAAREAYLRRPDGVRPDVTLDLERPSWDGVVVDYSLFSPSNDPIAGSAYGVGLGADVGGGSLEILAQSVGPADAGRVQVDASWNGVWRGKSWVEQVRLGEVTS